MYIIRRYIFTVIAVLLFVALLADKGYGWKWTKPRTQSQAKTYKYIKSHDYNHDGRVTAKDRLMWLKERKDSYSTVYVSDENEDLVGVMDLDKDGDVEAWEMKKFYSRYDKNNNGVLEENETDNVSN